MMSNFNIDNTRRELEKYEKLVQQAREKREKAIQAKSKSEGVLATCVDELKKLNIDPDHADEALVQYENEINAMLEEMKGLIPPELIASLQT
jgi:seryl-tRNA synthetase